VKYADAHGVLMVHAAGNGNRDIDAGGNFPTAVYLDGGMAKNWIEVGATSWKGGAALVASFSNYGQKRVDVFAPGEDILSTIPGNKYERDSGTSMAAPMVTGLAALMLSYYPDLTAADVKRIILQSASRYPSQMVTKPGAGADAALVPFGTLSATGGIVNAYAALRMAGSQSAGNQ
jgi:subtilisin family serine protease